MKIILLTLLAAVLLVAATVSCGSQKQSGEKTGQATDTIKDSLTMYYDSLAAMRGEIRDTANPIVTLHTSMGDMTLELYRDVAPAHADSFVARTKEGFYDSTTFFRVIDRFMIQGGDRTGTGRAPYLLNAEFSDLPHKEGTLSMARAMDPNSASSQFFICLERNQKTASLDGKYTVFGQLLKGYDVLHRIGSVECVPNPARGNEVSLPKEEVFLVRAYLSDRDGNELK
jgi:cyclophilin family peptidyl-prolyl cis-trans isomerase